MHSSPRTRRRLASLALATLFSGQSWALGLSSVLGEAVFGEHLHIRIPVLGTTPGNPVSDCFRLATPAAPMDGDYVLRDGRIRVELAQGQSYVIVTSARPWRQPVVEFRVVASCQGSEVARDYLLLAAMPAILPERPLAPSLPADNAASASSVAATPPLATATEPPQTRHTTTATTVRESPKPGMTASKPKSSEAPIASGPRLGATEEIPRKPAVAKTASPPAPEKPATPATAATQASATEVLHLKADTNLNALARSRFPDDREARDEFRRLVAQANPDLIMGKGPWGSVPLPAGTELIVPTKHASKEKEPAAARTKAPDRLMISGDSSVGVKPLSPREMASAIDRLERMGEDQGRTQMAIAESLKNLESTAGEVRKTLLGFEERMKQLEVERVKAEAERVKALAQLAEERSRFGILEMLLVVLASGVVGAGLIQMNYRLQQRKSGGIAPIDHDLNPPPLAIPRADEDSAFVAVRPVTATSPAKPASVPPPPQSKPLQPVPPPPKPVPAPPPRPAPTLPVPPPPLPLQPALPTRPLPVHDPFMLAEPVEPTHPPVIEFEMDLAPPDRTIQQAQTAALPLAPVPAIMAIEDPNQSPHDAALELAALMESMGLAKGAAQTLVEHINENPQGALGHWLKLLDIYHRADLHAELGDSVQQLRVRFNVALDDDAATGNVTSLENYPHLAKQLMSLWGTPGCDEFMRNLIEDTREGARVGFPRAVAEEIVLLMAISGEILKQAS